jgi:AcrR family transcriptional regulator
MSPVRKKTSVGRRPKTEGAELGTRTDILKAARGVFARNGFDGTSVREVAEEARVNKAMIYYHFRDKLELYREVLADSFKEFDRIWEHRIFNSPGSTKEKIKKYIVEFIRFQHKNDEIRRIMSVEFASSGGNYKWLADNVFHTGYTRLATIIQEGIKSGELKKMNPTLAISALTGMMIHGFIVKPLAVHMTGKNLDLSIGQFSAFITELFFEGIGSGSGSKKTRHARSYHP